MYLNHDDAAWLAAFAADLRGRPLPFPLALAADFFAADFLPEPAGLPLLPVFFATVVAVFAAPGLRPRLAPALRPRLEPGFGPRFAPALFLAAAFTPGLRPRFLPGFRPRFAPAALVPPDGELFNFDITQSTTLFWVSALSPDRASKTSDIAFNSGSLLMTRFIRLKNKII